LKPHLSSLSLIQTSSLKIAEKAAAAKGSEGDTFLKLAKDRKSLNRGKEMSDLFDSRDLGKEHDTVVVRSSMTQDDIEQQISDQNQRKSDRIVFTAVDTYLKQELLTLKFDANQYDKEMSVEIIAWFYIDLGLVNRYEIDVEHLKDFIRDAQSRHPRHSYHNWSTTTASCQILYHSLKIGGGGEIAAPQDMLAMYSALLEWGAEHPGVGMHLEKTPQTDRSDMDTAVTSGDNISLINYQMNDLLAAGAYTPKTEYDLVFASLNEHAKKVIGKVHSLLEEKGTIYVHLEDRNIVNLKRKTEACIKELIVCELGHTIVIPHEAKELSAELSAAKCKRRDSAVVGKDEIGAQDRTFQMNTKHIRPFVVNMYMRVAILGPLCRVKDLGVSAFKSLYMETIDMSVNPQPWLDMGTFVRQRVIFINIMLGVIQALRVGQLGELHAAVNKQDNISYLPTDTHFESRNAGALGL